MDGHDVSEADFAACLADLARVNTLTLARPPTLNWLKKATRDLHSFTLFDVGSGEGDMLRAIARWAQKQGKQARLVGIDLNPRAEPAARAATPHEMGIEYVTANVFDYAPASAPDFIISSICTHHMTDGEIETLLRWMDENATRGWFNNDLHRHWFPFYGFAALAQLARWHPFVRHDGPISIARSFRHHDWRRLVVASGLPEESVSIRWHFPFRICVGRTF
jgi:trans-aconitate methyltransferase